MAINYSQFPFAPMQKNPMGLLANPAQTAMQQRNSTGLLNLDPMQVQQARMRKEVADAEALNKRQMRGNMFMALGDAFAGREMNANFLARQQHFQAQKAAEEKRKQGLALGESAYDYILKTTGNADMAMLVKNNPTLANEVIKNSFAKPKERRIVEGVDGRKYYENGSLVLPDVEPKNTFEIKTTDVVGAQKEEMKTFQAANKGVKNFQQLLDAAQSADGAASYALMIKFIKQLDDSVVREGEVATFGGFQGALENLKLSVQKAKGEGFTPTVKANMINLATQTANRLVEDYNTYKAGKSISYSAIGFKPDMIFAGLDFNLKDLDLTKVYSAEDFEFIEFE